MKCGPGFKTNVGFKQYTGSLKKVLKFNNSTWQLYRRKEVNASYGTVTLTDLANLYIKKVNDPLTSLQAGIVSKEKINFSQYTKLKITYVSMTTNTDNYTNQVFCSDTMIENIPDYNSSVNWRDWDSLFARGAVLNHIANLEIPESSENYVTIECDITSITNENYLYISSRYENNMQAGTGDLYVSGVEFY